MALPPGLENPGYRMGKTIGKPRLSMETAQRTPDNRGIAPPPDRLYKNVPPIGAANG